MSTYDDFFFQKPMFPDIYDDEVNKRIGINTETPETTLDVAGDLTAVDITSSNLLTSNITSSNISTSNITACNVISATLATGDISADDLICDGISANAVQTINLVGSNLVGSNVTATTAVTAPVISATAFLEGLTINAASNLCWGGHSLYEPYPTDTNDWDDLIPFNPDMEGMIHESWIYKPLTAKDIFQDIWNIADLGIDMFQLLSDLSDFTSGLGGLAGAVPAAVAGAITGGVAGGVAGGVVDALKDLLSGDGDGEDDVKVHWKKVTNKPIATNNSGDLGIDGDFIIEETGKIKTNGGLGIDMNNNATMSAPYRTILDFGTSTLYLKNIILHDGTETNSNITLKGTDKNFRIQDWLFSSNVISNRNSPVSSIQFSTSNNNIAVAGSVQLDSNLSVYDMIVCDKYISKSNGGIQFTSNALKVEYQDDFTFNNSYLYMYNDTVEFKTKTGEELGTEEVLQFSIDSNGTMYTRSNLLMPSTAIIRSYLPESIDEPYREGLLNVSHNTLRYVSRSNVNGSNFDKIWWSVNSNGMFLLQRNAILGKNETLTEPDFNNPLSNIARTSFSRVETDLTNGFRFGAGISNDLTNRDYFKITRKGEIYSYSSSNDTLYMLTNSNAEVHKGTLRIDNEGNLKINNSNVILANGTIQRRSNPEVTDGFSVSPLGYLTMGGLLIQPTGVMTNTESVTLSNLTASNINSLTISENGSNLISKYTLSNNNSNWNWGSNTASWSSNNNSNLPTLYAPSNAMSNWNWGSNTALWSSNNTSNLPTLFASSNGMSNWNWGSNTASWSSNALSNYSVNATLSNYGLKTQTDWGSNTAFWSSNALSNYALSNHSHADKYWTGGTDKTYTYCNVGIGTNSPTQKLDVRGKVYIEVSSSQGLHVFNNELSSLENPAEIFLERNSFGFVQRCAVGMDRAGRDFFIWVNGSDRLNITTDGNVGIGEQPSVNYKLGVNGKVKTAKGIHIENGFDGLYLWGNCNVNYKWNIAHDVNGEGDSCGNLNFYADSDGANTLTHIAYIEDDVNIGATKLNFTGSHRVVEETANIDPERDWGLIVVASGKYNSLLPKLKKKQIENITIDEALPTVKLCSKRKDKAVLGVVSGNDTLTKDGQRRVIHQGNFKSCMKKEADDKRLVINALGEGAVWVVNTNGNFENGDFITTSSIAGYGERQDDDLIHNYTLGKITCDVDWSYKNLDKKFQVRDVEGFKAVFVGCIYLL